MLRSGRQSDELHGLIASVRRESVYVGDALVTRSGGQVGEVSANPRRVWLPGPDSNQRQSD